MFRLCLSSALVLLCLCVTAVYAGPQGEDQAELPEFGKLGEATLTPNEQNVVASELMGKWEYDAELSGRLADKELKEKVETLHFKENKESSDRILKQLKLVLGKLEEKNEHEKLPRLKRSMQTIYLCGSVEIVQGEKSMSFDFALTTLHGNPKIVIYEVDEDDFESANLMLARDDEGDNDILFLGGDFNNETFRAYRRVKQDAD